MKTILPALLLLSSLVPWSAFSQPVPPGPGVELPQAYFDRIAEDKAAFQFQRAWIQKAERVRRAREEFFERQWRPGMDAASIPDAVRSAMTVSGTVRVPVFLAKYSNTAATPYPPSNLQSKLFSPPPALSLTGLYNEMSYGNVTLTGTVYDWVPLTGLDAYYEAGCNGICPTAKTGQFLREILIAMDPTVDFGQYDNDGPDGVPNSGDDDGYVDFVAFVQPETGGECGTTNMWSHRWVVGGWPEFGRVGDNYGPPWETNDPCANGGVIVLWDYTLQPALGSAGCGPGITEIGVYCHEFGHAFGLPDLYDWASPSGAGIGHWGLMGSGNWNLPANPSHMCAWSKAELGWALPVEVGPFSQGYAIDNVETTPVAYKLDIMEEKFSRKSVGGSWRLHCGLTVAEASARGWIRGAGYGNAWDESMRRDFTYDGTTPVTLEYDFVVDTESDFDFGLMKIEVNSAVYTVSMYDGLAAGHAVVNLTPYLEGSGAASYRLIAQFQSDGGWSDEDGNFDSGAAGPFTIDNVSVVGGGVDYFGNFEENENGWYYDFNSNPSKEYFLVENRNADGAQFDQQLHGEGLAIWHVEQNVMAPYGLGNSGGSTNAVVRGVTLEEGDGLGHLIGNINRGDGGDIFPGTESNTSFNNDTNPNSKSHNNLVTNVLVDGISAPGAQMTATMRAGHLPPGASSIQPRFGYNHRQETIAGVVGAGFVHGATFLLRDDGQNEYPAAEVEWVGRTKLAGVVDLTGLSTGLYDVVVRNPDGQEAVLPDAFLVKDIVPVFVQAFDARVTERGIELTWDVWSDETVRGFRITRREEGSTVETILNNGDLVEADRRSFLDDTVLPGTSYEYSLAVMLAKGGEVRSPVVVARSAAFVLALMQNSPNPFNPSTRIDFSLPERQQVTLTVYDAEGRLVATLVDAARAAGMNDVVWDGRNGKGNRVTSGVYFYRLKTADRVLTKKMLLLK